MYRYRYLKTVECTIGCWYSYHMYVIQLNWYGTLNLRTTRNNFKFLDPIPRPVLSAAGSGVSTHPLNLSLEIMFRSTVL
jgi:hypothetical protein